MRWRFGAAVAGLVGLLVACDVKVPDLRDTRLFDRRIQETPRQKVVRECRQESDRFRVSCTLCHTNSDESKILPPDRLQLTPVGQRAQIMRASPTFGLHKQCSECHQSKFKLNQTAEALFGPGGAKRKEVEAELERQPVK